MKKGLKEAFKKAVLTTTLLTALPFSGFGIISNAQAGNIGISNNFNNVATEICSPRINSGPSYQATNIEKQILVDEAMFSLRKSQLANSYLQQQGGGACVSSYDIPVKLDKFGNTVIGRQNTEELKGDVVFLLADSMVNDYMEARGFLDRGHRGGIEGEFRTAVRMAMTAQILTEIERAGDNSGMQAALDTDFAPVFKNFKNHNIIDIQNGKAAIDAIKTYFKITDHRYHSHKISSRHIQHMYDMGERPNSRNIFQDFFRNGTNFSIKYFTNDKTIDNIYKKRPNNHHHRY